MPRRPLKLPDPLGLLKDLVRAGKLAEVRQWIADGKPIVYSEEARRQSVLEVAARSGFHAMVEEIVKTWADTHALNKALEWALRGRDADIARLLVEHGADVNSVSLVDVAECYDKDLMRLFLESGVDISRWDALARAIAAGARPLIGVFKEYCHNRPDAQVQLAKALKHFIREKSEKWVSLSLWMGADPRLVTTETGREDADLASSALEDACLEGDFEIVRLFKLDRQRDDLNYLLGRFFCLNIRVVDHLLAHGASINNKPNGGCSLLDTWFERFRADAPVGPRADLSEATETVIAALIRRGARLVPEGKRAYRDIRRRICELPQTTRSDFMKLISKACAPEVFWEIVRTKTMEEALGIKPVSLMQRLGLQVPGLAKGVTKERRGAAEPRPLARGSAPEARENATPEAQGVRAAASDDGPSGGPASPSRPSAAASPLLCPAAGE
jgi:hypothetical protein